VTCEETIVAEDIRVHPPPEPERGPREDGELAVRPDPALIAAGWTRRNVADPVRARETVDLYRSLGYEVKVVDLTPADLHLSCHACAPDICGSYVMIYTRRAETGRERRARTENSDVS
jgi:hypothetical protein